MSRIYAAVPIKEFDGAKQRLSSVLTPAQRSLVAMAMVEDVLQALSGARLLAGILVNTIDPCATELAQRYGARIVTEGARDGHTGAVNALFDAAMRAGCDAVMTIPGDVPRVTSAEIDALIASHRPGPSLTIAPAHDELGSNAIICSPPRVMPLRFGDDSYFPHLMTARAHGIEPTIVRLPGVGLDIDHPADLRAFMRAAPYMPTRTFAALRGVGF